MVFDFPIKIEVSKYDIVRLIWKCDIVKFQILKSQLK